MATRTPVVTPEAVVLQFETAGLGSRLLATLIDLAVQGSVLVLTSTALLSLAGAAGADATVGVVVLVAAFTAVLLGYPIAFETLWRGRTPGKAALGLRVVTADGAPVRFRHAAVRGFLTLVDFYLTSGAVAIVAVLLTRENLRLGDLAAGTLVLRERTGAGRPAAARFPVPPGYEGYVATLDVSGLSADVHGTLRSFLLRAPALSPGVRASLADQVAATVARHVPATPPAQVPPEAFLQCVAAAHQRRWAARRPVPAGIPSVWDRTNAPAAPAPPTPATPAAGPTGFALPP